MLLELQPGEQILSILRKHYLLLMSRLGIIGLLFLLPVFLMFIPLGKNTGGITTFFGALWMLAMLGWGFVVWTKYYLDTWIVTNCRLVDIDQVGLFNRKSSTLDLKHIEDITIRIEGFVNSIIECGTLSVQTAGHIQEFRIENIAYPEAAKQAIYSAKITSQRLEQSEMGHAIGTHPRVEE